MNKMRQEVHPLLLVSLFCWSTEAIASEDIQEILPVSGARFSLGDSEDVSPESGWLGWSNVELSNLLSSGLVANSDILTAMTQIEQASAVASQVAANVLPTVALQGSMNVSPTSSSGFGNPTVTVLESLSELLESSGEWGSEASSSSLTSDLSDNMYAGSTVMTVSVPVDIWGANINRWQAARWDSRVSRSVLETVKITVSGLIASVWIDAVYCKAQLRVLAEQIELAQRILTLTHLRYENGEASALDVVQQQQQLAATQALVPPLRGALRASEQQLAVLTGEGHLQTFPIATQALPELPDLPAVGTPLELMDRAPEVLVALGQYYGADHRRKAASKGLAPTIGISGQYGWQHVNMDGEQWQSEPTWGGGLTLTMPIFHGGGNLGAIRAAHAAVDGARNELIDAVQTAIYDVEVVLIKEQEGAASHALISQQVAAARMGFELAEREYRQGVVGHLTLLLAQQGLTQAELSLLTSSRDRLYTRVQLYQALSLPLPAGEVRGE